MRSIRVVDLGEVPAVTSQAVYHAVAYAQGPDSPNTLLLVSSSEPYVSIGFHQEAEREVDLEYCGREGLPVVRREVGGGAVYLDRGQVFCQWIFHGEDLPASLDARFSLYIRPLVETYRALGVEAYHRPINDIHVAGRKIGGTGAARIGDAEVLVGSLMFDFDFDRMARVLRVPSEKFRDKVRKGLDDYMTTMRRELGGEQDRSRVKALYAERCAEVLGADLLPGGLTGAEREAVAKLEPRFRSAEWLHRKGGLLRTGVKIHADVHIVESMHKAPGGLIRTTARIAGGRIDDIGLSGDFTVLPASAVADLEAALVGATLDPSDLRDRVLALYAARDVQSPGVGVEDWLAALAALAAPAGPPT